MKWGRWHFFLSPRQVEISYGMSELVVHLQFTTFQTACMVPTVSPDDAMLQLQQLAPTPLDTSAQGVLAMQKFNAAMQALVFTQNGPNPALQLLLPNRNQLIVVGPSFNALPVSQQMTIFIHEMIHVSNPTSTIDFNRGQTEAQMTSSCGISATPF
jgi:hypothetical protein